MLDLIAAALKAEGIPFVRVDGKTNAAARKAAIQAFAGTYVYAFEFKSIYCMVCAPSRPLKHIHSLLAFFTNSHTTPRFYPQQQHQLQHMSWTDHTLVSRSVSTLCLHFRIKPSVFKATSIAQLLLQIERIRLVTF